MKEPTVKQRKFSSPFTFLVSLGLALLGAAVVPRSTGIAQQTFIDPSIQSHILRGVDFVTNTDYLEAYNEFEKIKALAPDDPSSYFLKGMIYWYRLVIEGEDSKVIENLFFKYMDQTIEKAKQLEKGDQDDILALFWLGAGYGYKARHHSVKGQWWSAYRNGKRTKHYFERVVALSPDDYDPYLGLGIYHYYAEVVPKIIRIFDFILNMGGDKELGLRELEMTLDKGFFTRNEARFFFVDIFLNYEKRPWDALPFLVDLTRHFPGNRGFKWQLAELYGQLRLPDAAATLWGELVDAYPDSSGKKGAALVHLGEQRLRCGTFAASDSILHQAVAGNEPLDPSGLGRAYYALGLSSDLLGRGDEALAQYRKVVETGTGELVKVSQQRIDAPDELPIEIIHDCAEILTTVELSGHRVDSFAEQAYNRLSGSGQHRRKLRLSAMKHIGTYYLFHGQPSKARDMFTEMISSDLVRDGDLEASLYELRGVANFRLHRFTEAVDDFERAYEGAGDSQRERIEKDMAYIRASIERDSSAGGDGQPEVSGQRTLAWTFTYPDRGQLAVSVVGGFNGWDPTRGEMSLASGQWTKEFELQPGKHTYFFLINGHERRIDPRAMTVERQTGTRYVSVRTVDH